MEGDSELKSLKCNGNIIKLDEYSPESLMASLPELAGDTTASPENLPDTPKQEIYVPPRAEVHPVNITATAYSDESGWMDENGNDPETVNPGMADVPERLDPAEDPQETPEAESPAETKASTFVISEDELRELSMTVSAMEASRLCNVASGDLGDTSVEIIRRNAAVPNFLTIYGECLKKAGNPRSLEELAAAFPHFHDWILTEEFSLSGCGEGKE